MFVDRKGCSRNTLFISEPQLPWQNKPPIYRLKCQSSPQHDSRSREAFLVWRSCWGGGGGGDDWHYTRGHAEGGRWLTFHFFFQNQNPLTNPSFYPSPNPPKNNIQIIITTLLQSTFPTPLGQNHLQYFIHNQNLNTPRPPRKEPFALFCSLPVDVSNFLYILQKSSERCVVTSS